MSKKSLKINMILNGSKTVLGIIFPLITLPYVNRILQVENLGKVNFSYSIVNYFILLSGLGISTYAIREGGKLKNNKEEVDKFVNQMFTINILSTVLSYSILFIFIICSNRLYDYRQLIIIQSFSIIGSTIGVNWIYQIYEDYLYITIRTIAVQIISLVLLFMLVKSNNDYVKYAWISVVANVGANIFNFLYVKKYHNIKITSNIKLKKHLIPILIIFASNIAVTIYVNSDSTMIGYLCGINGDYYLGLYSTSVKVYTILKTLISALILVALPRLSFYIANKKEYEYTKTSTKIFNSMFVFLAPIVLGINIMCNNIIYILGGESYLPATTSLHILSISLIFSILAIYFTNVVLIPFNMERIVLKATIISAIINIILNLVLIPKYNHNGAAISTLISEGVVCFIEWIYVKDRIRIKLNINGLCNILISSLTIIFIYFIITTMNFGVFTECIIIFILSVISYFTTMILLKDEETISLLLSFGIVKKIFVKMKIVLK